MVPELPTPTNLVVSSVVVVVVVPEFSVESSFSSLQEMTVKLKRKRERIMRRCFIGFLIGYFRNTLNIPELGGVLQESGILLGERSGESGKQLMFFMGDSKMVSVLNLKRSQV